MTYFETPNSKAAYIAGTTLVAYEAQEEALIAFRETYGEADLDREDRVLVSEDDVETVTAQDREDLQTVLDWEEFHI
jgi:hypothetical protein